MMINLTRVVLIMGLICIFYFGYTHEEFAKTVVGSVIGLTSSITIIGSLWVTRNE